MLPRTVTSVNRAAQRPPPDPTPLCAHTVRHGSTGRTHLGVRRPGFQALVLPLSHCGPQQAFGLSRPQFPHLANGSVGPRDPTPAPPDKEIATHSGTLAWEIPWTEEPGGLHTTESPRVGHDLAMKKQGPLSTKAFTNDAKTPVQAQGTQWMLHPALGS